MKEHRWTVKLFIDEGVDDGTKTVTYAQLDNRDGVQLTGRGVAQRSPHDNDVPEIGDELSASRALHDVADQLLQASADDVSQATHEQVDLKH
ncbi:DUF1876 domain-containing protein [Williamsia sp.]|uniref:DUF1876 domain-containing protein n=1 Tax=Williamsia sp. TaxID=1872085 RepID=UPI002F92601F